MKLPRDLNGSELAKILRRLDYAIQRQSGSHMTLTTHRNGEHHITIPNHRPLKIGTLRGILGDVALHHQFTMEDLRRQLDL
jgi:predicted RNA binding protein YcfA (HicA-like mRNA interferase family)